MVRLRASAKAEADERFIASIIEAHEAGCTLREIEASAGISRETVRKIITRKGQ